MANGKDRWKSVPDETLAEGGYSLRSTAGKIFLPSMLRPRSNYGMILP